MASPGCHIDGQVPGLSPAPHAHNELNCLESHTFIPGIFIPGIKRQWGHLGPPGEQEEEEGEGNTDTELL